MPRGSSPPCIPVSPLWWLCTRQTGPPIQDPKGGNRDGYDRVALSPLSSLTFFNINYLFDVCEEDKDLH